MESITSLTYLKIFRNHSICGWVELPTFTCKQLLLWNFVYIIWSCVSARHILLSDTNTILAIVLLTRHKRATNRYADISSAFYADAPRLCSSGTPCPLSYAIAPLSYGIQEWFPPGENTAWSCLYVFVLFVCCFHLHHFLKLTLISFLEFLAMCI